MCHDKLRENLANLHAGEILTVADGALVLLLALELEHQRLLAAAMTFDHTRHTSVRHGGTSLNVIPVHDRQHTAELYLRAHVPGQGFDFHELTRRDTILLAAGFNDCVHS